MQPVWVRGPTSPPLRTFRLLASDPKDGRVVAAAGKRSVYVTTDGAGSWFRAFRARARRDGVNRASADLVRAIAVGGGRLFVATTGGLWWGRATGRLTRTSSLPLSHRAAQMVFRPARGRKSAKRGRLYVLAGRRVWVQKQAGSPLLPVGGRLSEPVFRLAVAAQPSRHLAVAGRKRVYVSTDLGKRFEPVATAGRCKDLAFVESHGGGLMLVVASTEGVELYEKDSGRWKRAWLRTEVTGARSVEPDPGGRAETFWVGADQLWLAAGDVEKLRRADLGLDGGRRLVAASPAAHPRPLAWAATRAGLFRVAWAAVGPPSSRRRLRCSAGDVVRSLPEPEISRLRARWARLLPELSVRATMVHGESEVAARSSAGVGFGVFLTLTWRLSDIFGSSWSAPGRSLRAALAWRRKMARRAYDRRASCTRLARLAGRVSGLGSLERASLRLQLEAARASLRR